MFGFGKKSGASPDPADQEFASEQDVAESQDIAQSNVSADERTGFFSAIGGALLWLFIAIGGRLPLIGKYIRRLRKKRKFETDGFGDADEVKKREELRKALVSIRKAGFYTYPGLASLVQEYYERDYQGLIAESNNANRPAEERAQLRLQARERLYDINHWLKAHKIKVGRQFRIVPQLSSQLRDLGESGEKYVKVPGGPRLKLVHHFFKESGLLKSPVPLNWLVKKPDIVQNLVYSAAGSGDMLYHTMRIAMGQDDPKKALKDDDAKNPPAFAGAVYLSFIFDSPYFKRGVFVVRNGTQSGPVEVEYYEGWRSELPTQRDPRARRRELATLQNLPGTGGHQEQVRMRAMAYDAETGEPSTALTRSYADEVEDRAPPRFTQRFEEYYRGYLLDQGYDSYVFLFGPEDPSLKFNDPYNALLAFRGLDKLIAKFGRTPGKEWDPRQTDVADFLRGLSLDAVRDTLANFLRNSDEVVREAIDSGQFNDDGGRTRLVSDYTGRATMDALWDDPLLRGIPMEPEEQKERDYPAEAEGLRDALWKLFEVDGRPSPKAGQHRRIRTLYLEGANRAALTPNVLRGTVQAFDNMSKSEMLLERTIMYRLGLSTTNPLDLAKITVVARNRSERFDMRQYLNPSHPEDARQVLEQLEEFEPGYREIFLALGYDIGMSGDQRKAFRINPVVSNTTADDEDVEFVLE